MPQHLLAIDFGTTNSAIARFDPATGQGNTVELPSLSHPTSSGDFLIPTLLYVQDGHGEVTIGHAVRAQGLDSAPGNRLFVNFKRAMSAESPFDARLIDGVPWTHKDAGQQFLKNLLAALPFSAADIETLVITVPVAAFESYTIWLRGLPTLPADRLKIVDESTAAALGYAVTEPGALVLVIDFGGGTLDLSLVRLPDPRAPTGKILFTSETHHSTKATVIAKAGAALGGSDIDQWLLAEVLRRADMDRTTLGTGYAALLAACEQAKIALSTRDTAPIIFQPEHGTPTTLPFTRAELETLMTAHGFFTALRQALEKVMGLAHQKGVYREDIHHVLLVGGTALIPSVQQTLDAYFRAITARRHRIYEMPEWPSLTWSVDNTTIRVDKPFTAVVEGALKVATGFELDDRLGHGYALRVWDGQAHRWDELIPIGASYPTEKPVTVPLGAARPGQTQIALLLGQINGDTVDAQTGENVRQIVPLTPAEPLTFPLTPAGERGSARLLATFRVDAARHLRLTVTDAKTNATLLQDALIVSPFASPKQGAEAPPTNPFVVGASAPDNAPMLVAAPKSGGGFLKGLAKKMFGFLPQSALSANTLGEALLSEDALVRFEAAKTLTERGDRESRLMIEEVLARGTPPQRASVVWHLGRTTWFTAEPLLRRALDDADPRVREAAVFALCKMRQPEAYKLVMEILEKGNDPARMSAVWGLSTHPDASAVPVLELALQAENPEIRVQVLEVLGATAAPEALPAVRRAVDDPDLDVKYAATLSWVELADESCFEDLAQVLLTTSGQARRMILRGFFHATNYLGMNVAGSASLETLLAALEAALTDELPETRSNASLPLAWVRHPRAEQMLIEAFHRERDSDVRAHMLSNAVHLMSPVGARLMAEALAGEDVLVRQTAEYLRKTFKNG
ncbi:MAG: HEAT repeat domain-containing protein [Anaerolineales bacterium]|nr:HEAT repeat domain-containing protein [Anaerolineales bacterium]